MSHCKTSDFLHLEFSYFSSFYRRIRAVHQTISLIHHLIFNTDTDSPHNFRKLLQDTQHPRFTGIIHMFIVTFGRLSYARDLDWMNDKRRREMGGVYGERQI